MHDLGLVRPAPGSLIGARHHVRVEVERVDRGGAEHVEDDVDPGASPAADLERPGAGGTSPPIRSTRRASKRRCTSSRTGLFIRSFSAWFRSMGR